MPNLRERAHPRFDSSQNTPQAAFWLKSLVVKARGTFACTTVADDRLEDQDETWTATDTRRDYRRRCRLTARVRTTFGLWPHYVMILAINEAKRAYTHAPSTRLRSVGGPRVLRPGPHGVRRGRPCRMGARRAPIRTWHALGTVRHRSKAGMAPHTTPHTAGAAGHVQGAFNFKTMSSGAGSS
jgi:hypothetical protein